MTVLINFIAMSRLALKLRDHIPTDVFTELDVRELLGGTPDRRYGLIKRALANRDLIQVRRGVYAFGKRFQRQVLNLFELAQRVYAPSYISAESALSFHGLIPEATYTVTSVCLKRSTTFETSVGNFSYTRAPKYNLVGVERITDGNSIFLMANPSKALMDYVLTNKLDVANFYELLESLRVDANARQRISLRILRKIANVYRSQRAWKLVRSLRKDIER